MNRSSKEVERALYQLAHQQGGYFTAKQADEIGYGYRHLDYHETAGNFQRVGHGLYRLPTIPPAEHDELIRWTFWSRNQKDEPQAVISHESALVLHDLSDILPNKIHLTVPSKFRKEIPPGCIIHKAKLFPEETEERIGFRVTTPLRTILDVSEGEISQEQLEKAVTEALDRGLVQRKKLVELLRGLGKGNRLRAIVVMIH